MHEVIKLDERRDPRKGTATRAARHFINNNVREMQPQFNPEVEEFVTIIVDLEILTQQLRDFARLGLDTTELEKDIEELRTKEKYYLSGKLGEIELRIAYADAKRRIEMLIDSEDHEELDDDPSATA